MTEQELRQRACLIYAVRVRKQLNKIRHKSTPDELKAGVRLLLVSKFWKHIGYNRLYDYLVDELQMPYEQASDLVVEAVKLKIENGDLYGITSNTDSSGQSAGSTTNSNPGVINTSASVGATG